MNGKFFQNVDAHEQEILKAEFSKFIKHSSHIVRELVVEQIEPKESGMIYVQSMLDTSYSLGILSDDNRNLAYSGELNYEEVVSMLLKIFITNHGIFDEVQQSDRVSLRIAQNNYEALQKYIDSEIEGTCTEVTSETSSKREDNGYKTHILETSTLEILSILIAQTHKSSNDNYSKESATELDDYLNFLRQENILTELELIDAISSNDIERTIYEIFKERIFGKIIPESSYLYDCLLEFETIYIKDKIKNLTALISDEALNTLQNFVNSDLIENILILFEYSESEDYDFETLLSLMRQEGIITQKQEIYFRTINITKDKVYYITIILESSKTFWKRISINDVSEIKDGIYGFHLMYGDLYPTNTLSSRTNLDSIESLAENLIELLVTGNHELISHNYLDDILAKIRKLLPHRPLYFHLSKKMNYDDIEEVTSPFHKAIQILGILVCDILDINHPLFEDASELLLCNIRGGEKHATIVRMIQSKSLSNNPTSP